MSSTVLLKFGTGNLKDGFTNINIRIEKDGKSIMSSIGALPPAPDLAELLIKWQGIFSTLNNINRGSDDFEFEDDCVTNVSVIEFGDICQEIKDQLNNWLNSVTFHDAEMAIRTELKRDEQIRVILETDDLRLWKLPWHLWDFFTAYPMAELGIGPQQYRAVQRESVKRSKLRALAILGNSAGIDVNADRNFLSKVPDLIVTFLVEPSRADLSEKLWGSEWDILYFAGHGTNETGQGLIKINKKESLSVAELKNGLKRAIDKGLKMAIFNSCHGIELAKDLADLSLPQLIVMKQQVPDQVAQQFLKNFLHCYFNDRKPFYLAVREARERLEGVEGDYPCASWLPVICQNPAEEADFWQRPNSLLPINNWLQFRSALPINIWQRTRSILTVKFGVTIAVLMVFLLLNTIFLFPNLSGKLLHLGKDFQCQEDYQKALYALQAASILGVAADSNLKAEIYYERGVCLNKLDRLKEAYEDYNTAISFNDNLTRAYLRRGIIIFSPLKLWQQKEALSDYQRVIDYASDPDYFRDSHKPFENTMILLHIAYLNRGQYYLMKEDHEKAIADLTNAIDNAVRFQKFNDLSKLQPQFRELVDRLFHWAYALRGQSYFALNKIDLAMSDLNQAIEMNKNFPVRWLDRGRVFYQLNQYPQVIADCNQALQISEAIISVTYKPASEFMPYYESLRYGDYLAQILFLRGQAKEQLGLLAEANDDYKAALKNNEYLLKNYDSNPSENALRHCEHAQIMKQLHRYDEAISDYQLAADLYSKAGKTDKSTATLKKIDEVKELVLQEFVFYQGDKK